MACTLNPYRMPAEWESQACVWISRPDRHDTWPGCLEQAQKEFDYFANRMKLYVEVKETHELNISTDDAWIRDYGSLYVLNNVQYSNSPLVTCQDFRFNSWGGKYPPWENNDAATQKIAKLDGINIHHHNEVVEGGAIDVNGSGTALVSTSSLLPPNRTHHLNKTQLEKTLLNSLGIRHFIWLYGHLHGDDTDGHIDTFARFINLTTVVTPRTSKNHHDHRELERNW